MTCIEKQELLIRQALLLAVISALAAIVFFFFGPNSAYAAEVASGDYSNGTVHWSIDDSGVLTISGTGAVGDECFGNATKIAATLSGTSLTQQNIKSLVIEEGLTAIEPCAFEGLLSLTGELVIPASVESVGDTFLEFTDVGITKLVFAPGSKVTSFPQLTAQIGFFQGFPSLKEITLPDSMTAIDNSAFKGCSSLETINGWPAGLTTIGTSAFRSCTSLASIPEWPDTLTSIGAHAFRDCSSLASIPVFPNNVLNIGGNAFNGTALSGEIYVPEGSTFNANSFPSGVTTTSVPPAVQYPTSGTLDCGATWSYDYTTKTLTLAGENTSTGEAFKEELSRIKFASDETLTVQGSFSDVKKLVFAGETTSIPMWFAGKANTGNDLGIPLTSLEEVEFGANIETIGQNAFTNRTTLKSIAFAEDSNCTHIGWAAFQYCSALTTADLSTTKIVNLDNGTEGGANQFDGTGLTNVVFPECLEVLDGAVFRDCADLEEVHLPASIKTVGRAVFQGDEGIKVYVPASVQSISKELANISHYELHVHGAMNQALPAFAASVTDYEDYLRDNGGFITALTFEPHQGAEGASYEVCLDSEHPCIEFDCAICGRHVHYDLNSVDAEVLAGFDVEGLKGVKEADHRAFEVSLVEMAVGEDGTEVALLGEGEYFIGSPITLYVPVEGIDDVESLNLYAQPYKSFDAYDEDPDPDAALVNDNLAITAKDGKRYVAVSVGADFVTGLQKQYLLTIDPVTLTFNTQGGSTVDAQTLEYGATATAPADPKKEGSEFTGWFKDAAGEQGAFDFTAPVTKNTTAYAVWSEVDRSALEKAIADAKAAEKDVKTSADGSDIPKSQKWVTPAAKKALDDAVAAAEALGADATQAQVNAAAKAVTDALANFKPADGKLAEIVAVDRTALEKAVADAKAAEQGVKTSADGSDVAKTDKWVTPAAKKALDDAIAAAGKLGADATQAQVNAAAKAVNDALAKFKPAPGTKADGPAPGPDPEPEPEPQPEPKPASIADAQVAAIPDQPYTGKAIEPALTVTLDGKTLKAGTDYVVGYAENVNLGTAVARITGMGDYTGTNWANFEIVKSFAGEADRLMGETMLDTMAAIVDQGWAGETGGTVVLTTVAGYWDALTAAGIAGMTQAPVLMTDRTELSAQTAAELKKLAPKKIIVCGGPAVVAEDVVKAAAAAAGGAETVQIYGETMTDTADEVYKQAPKEAGGTWNGIALLCTSNGYWDALAAAPLSYGRGMPILLTESLDSVSASTLAVLKSEGIQGVIIVGGEAVVSKNVDKQLEAAGVKVFDRLWGQTAIDTSMAVAEYALSFDMRVNNMGVATQNGYWDALSGAAFCGKNNSVLVLVDDVDDSTSIDGFIKAHSSRINQVWVFGGQFAVNAAVFGAIQAVL